MERKKIVTYKEARVYLDNVSKYGSVLGLDTIRNLLHELGDPQDALSFIHIAGTNGKGSVLAYLSSIFCAAGYRTGRYISPTVMGYLERIQIDGRWISEDVFAELVEEVQKAVARMEAEGKQSPTVFEIETAIAFLYFKRAHCDLVVLETGLGGALDATNIVSNVKAAVFTSISRDHMGVLGNTLEEIAANKAGIIKPGCMVISSAQEPEVHEVIKKCAEEKGCSLIFTEPEKIQIEKETYRGQTFSYKGTEALSIRLAGRHQLFNAITAWETAYALEIPEDVIRQGLYKAEWIGRFTTICEEPLFLVDGAHNADAAKRLRESLETYFPGKRLICIMGVFRDKEYEEIAKIMLPLAKQVYTVNLPDTERTLLAGHLKQTLDELAAKEGLSVQVQAAGAVETAVKLAAADAKNEDTILAFGSLSYLGEVIRCAENILGERGGSENDRSGEN